MAANNFNIDIPDSVIAQILGLLIQAGTLLDPYKQAITEAGKTHLHAIADKSIPFAEKSDAYLDSEPKFNPPYIDIVETHKDFKNFQKVHPLCQKVNGLQKELKDIDIAAGSDAYGTFLEYYKSVRTAAKHGVPGAKTIYDDLSQFFPGHKKQIPPVPPTKP